MIISKVNHVRSLSMFILLITKCRSLRLTSPAIQPPCWPNMTSAYKAHARHEATKNDICQKHETHLFKLLTTNFSTKMFLFWVSSSWSCIFQNGNFTTSKRDSVRIIVLARKWVVCCPIRWWYCFGVKQFKLGLQTFGATWMEGFPSLVFKTFWKLFIFWRKSTLNFDLTTRDLTAFNVVKMWLLKGHLV